MKDDGPFATGLMPQFMRDQNSNSYDIYINVPNTGESITPNKATLKLTDTVMNMVRRPGSLFSGKITLPNPVFDILTDFENNNKDYATEIEIDVNSLTLPNMKQGTIINQNGEYDVVNNDGNNDDIEFQKQNNTPTPTPQLLLRKKDLRDDPMNDDTETTLGSFTVNIPAPNIIDTIENNGYYKFNESWNALVSGSEQDHQLVINVPTPVLDILQNANFTLYYNNNSFTISEYNLENNTQYDAVQNINITPALTSVSLTSKTNSYTIQDYNTINNTNYIGFSSIDTSGIPSDAPQLSLEQSKTITITNNDLENSPITVSPSAGYDAMETVQVDLNITMPQIQREYALTITEDGVYNINPGVGYAGIDGATITVQTDGNTTVEPNKTQVISENGTVIISPDNGYNALGQVTVNVDVPSNTLESQKSVTITNNGTTTITPDTGYDGIRELVITTTIPPAIPIINNYTYPTITQNGNYPIPNDYSGLNGISVNVIPSINITQLKSEVYKSYWNDGSNNHSSSLYTTNVFPISGFNYITNGHSSSVSLDYSSYYTDGNNNRHYTYNADFFCFYTDFTNHKIYFGKFNGWSDNGSSRTLKNRTGHTLYYVKLNKYTSNANYNYNQSYYLSDNGGLSIGPISAYIDTWDSNDRNSIVIRPSGEGNGPDASMTINESWFTLCTDYFTIRNNQH